MACGIYLNLKAGAQVAWLATLGYSRVVLIGSGMLQNLKQNSIFTKKKKKKGVTAAYNCKVEGKLRKLYKSHRPEDPVSQNVTFI